MENKTSFSEIVHILREHERSLRERERSPRERERSLRERERSLRERERSPRERERSLRERERSLRICTRSMNLTNASDNPLMNYKVFNKCNGVRCFFGICFYGLQKRGFIKFLDRKTRKMFEKYLKLCCDTLLIYNSGFKKMLNKNLNKKKGKPISFPLFLKTVYLLQSS